MNTDKDSKILSPYAYSFEHTDVERHSKKTSQQLKILLEKKKILVRC